MSNLPCEKKPSFRYPIGFWNYLSVQVTPVSQVESWKRAGITCNQTPFFSYGSHDPADMVAMLDEMHRAGMRAFVCVSDLDFHRFLQDPEAFRPVFARAYADFGRHPATYGFFIGDEPLNGQEFSACVRAYQIMREIAPELTPLLNFNPYWEGMENDLLGGEAFDAWIDRFVRESGCPLICYDCYSQMNPGDEGINMYFRNLNRYVGAAERNGVMVWNTLLSCGHFRYRVPDEDDIRWQLSTTVASGCDGILWFLWYGQNLTNNYRGAPIDELGEESATYAAIRRVQLLFHRRYGTLMNRLRHEKTYHFCKAYGGYPLYSTYDLPHLRKAVSDHGLPGIVSSFTDEEGNRYLVLVNNSPRESGLFWLIFDGGVRQVHRYWDRNGEMCDMDFIASHHDAHYGDDGNTARIGLWLAPGQMEVLRVSYD